MCLGCSGGREAGMVAGSACRGPGRGQSQALRWTCHKWQSCQALASDLSKGRFELLGEEEEEDARQKDGKGGLEARGAVSSAVGVGGRAGLVQHMKG